MTVNTCPEIDQGYELNLLISNIETELSSVDYMLDLANGTSLKHPVNLPAKMAAVKHSLNAACLLAKFSDEVLMLMDDDIDISSFVRQKLESLKFQITRINEWETV